MWNKHHRFTPTYNSSLGFSLIELVVSLSVFSILVIISYSALTSTFQQDQALEKVLDWEAEQRSAYQILTLAFATRARLVGDSNSINVMLNGADDPAFMQYDNLELWWDNGAALYAKGNTAKLPSQLLEFARDGEFFFLSGDQELSRWTSTSLPDALGVRFLGLGKERQSRWVFAVGTQ